MTAQHHPVHTSPNIVQFFSFPFFVFFFYYLRFFFFGNVSFPASTHSAADVKKKGKQNCIFFASSALYR